MLKKDLLYGSNVPVHHDNADHPDKLKTKLRGL
jgi:hypothetical protein